MISTPFIRDCIVDKEKTHLIHGAIAAGTSQYGMQTFDQSIFGLFQQGLVSYEEALRWASNVDEFKLRVQGISTTADMSRDQMARTVIGRRAPEITRFGTIELRRFGLTRLQASGSWLQAAQARKRLRSSACGPCWPRHEPATIASFTSSPVADSLVLDGLPSVPSEVSAPRSASDCRRRSDELRSRLRRNIVEGSARRTTQRVRNLHRTSLQASRRRGAIPGRVVQPSRISDILARATGPVDAVALNSSRRLQALISALEFVSLSPEPEAVEPEP